MYEKTVLREYQKLISQEKTDWQKTAHVLAAIYNAAMGSKKKHTADDFMPEFEDDPFNQKNKDKTYLEQAEKLGLKTPSTKKI